MDSVLYVGFKGKNNSSYQLVNRMHADTFFLTNSFAGVKRGIENLPTAYEKVVMFGLDKTLRESIRFEETAQKDGELLHTTMEIAPYLLHAEQNHILYTISDRPTMYLCNEAYFFMLKRMHCPVLFVHIPSVSHMSDSFFDRLKKMFEEIDK